MFGISYGELFLLIGATAALVGPKDLPKIARTAGRLAGRAIGYVQIARGQFDNVMQQTQAQQVHKELQDAMAKLDAIRHEVRSLSFVNPGPSTRSLAEARSETADDKSQCLPESIILGRPGMNPTECLVKEQNSRPAVSTELHAQAIAYYRLAKSEAIKAASLKRNDEASSSTDESDAFPILPVSAESTGLLPNRKEHMKGSDILLEAVVEAEVAHKAKDFFALHGNQLK